MVVTLVERFDVDGDGVPLTAASDGIGGGETFGKLTFCDRDNNVPPLILLPLPGPDDDCEVPEN
jgi:hypothetical protein